MRSSGKEQHTNQVKSIITNSDNCFIHSVYYSVDVPGTEYHHCVHGLGRRKLADEDGLIVPLCHVCHRLLHDKGYHDKDLQKWAQKAWMEHYGKSANDFIQRYGKSYL